MRSWPSSTRPSPRWSTRHTSGAPAATTRWASPLTSGAFQTSWPGGNKAAFVTKISPLGAVVYATFLGGSDRQGDEGDVAVDASGHAYVTGITASTDFPTTAGAYRTTGGGNNDVYVTELGSDGSSLV